MTTYDFVEGWTEALDFQLRIEDDFGVMQPWDATGCTVTLILSDRNNEHIDYDGTVDWLDATTSTVTFMPAATDLLYANSPCKAYWQVTDGLGKSAFFPNAKGDQWVIRKP